MNRGHYIILNHYIDFLKEHNIKRILDAGSGRTSLSAIIQNFPEAHIEAVIYPGDIRKLESLQPLLLNTDNVKVLETDICSENISSEYDLVIAHLLLGEATKFGNSFELLLKRLMQIKCRYLIIIDYLEDPTVNEGLIVKECDSRNYEIIYRSYMRNDNPQIWDDFIGKHNFGYLLRT